MPRVTERPPRSTRLPNTGHPYRHPDRHDPPAQHTALTLLHASSGLDNTLPNAAEFLRYLEGEARTEIKPRSVFTTAELVEGVEMLQRPKNMRQGLWTSSVFTLADVTSEGATNRVVKCRGYRLVPIEETYDLLVSCHDGHPGRSSTEREIHRRGKHLKRTVVQTFLDRCSVCSSRERGSRTTPSSATDVQGSVPLGPSSVNVQSGQAFAPTSAHTTTWIPSAGVALPTPGPGPFASTGSHGANFDHPEFRATPNASSSNSSNQWVHNPPIAFNPTAHSPTFNPSYPHKPTHYYPSPPTSSNSSLGSGLAVGIGLDGLVGDNRGMGLVGSPPVMNSAVASGSGSWNVDGNRSGVVAVGSGTSVIRNEAVPQAVNYVSPREAFLGADTPEWEQLDRFNGAVGNRGAPNPLSPLTTNFPAPHLPYPMYQAPTNAPTHGLLSYPTIGTTAADFRENASTSASPYSPGYTAAPCVPQVPSFATVPLQDVSLNVTPGLPAYLRDSVTDQTSWVNMQSQSRSPNRLSASTSSYPGNQSQPTVYPAVMDVPLGTRNLGSGVHEMLQDSMPAGASSHLPQMYFPTPYPAPVGLQVGPSNMRYGNDTGAISGGAFGGSDLDAFCDSSSLGHSVPGMMEPGPSRESLDSYNFGVVGRSFGTASDSVAWASTGEA